MEEAKAAVYYDELTRKGEGAARFKQGLGFSSSSSSSSKPSSSSSPLFSSFIRASSPGKASELEKQAQLASIQNKLWSKPHKDGFDRDHRHRSEERSSHRHRERRRGKWGGERRERDKERERDSYNRSSRRSNRSPSPLRRASSSSKSKSSRVDYSSLIEGYDRMTPSERVKAKMKLQLSETGTLYFALVFLFLQLFSL
ncbi:uncharacterized protein [Typha angustifolia]|uniref:uncharacterized protein n=1 Tax=Typha angustifolia TaxID=59011 RepID=UPI003C2BC1CA